MEIEKAARRVYYLLTLRNRPSQTERTGDPTIAGQAYRSAAERLSQIVLGPAARLLQGKRLLIVCDGALQYIPFAALPAPDSDADAIPLIVKHEIVNLPSASVLAELRRQRTGRPKATRTVAVLADPVFDPKDERVKVALGRPTSSVPQPEQYADLTRSANDLGLIKNGRLYLNRLLYTRNEAEAVMAATPPEKAMLALDFEASRNTAMSPALARYRIVHFATHGLLNNRHPELSGLVLSLVDQQGKARTAF
jgi:CHAT domain-containing protein